MEISQLNSKVFSALPQPQLLEITSGAKLQVRRGKKISTILLDTGLVSARLNPTNLKAWVAG